MKLSTGLKIVSFVVLVVSLWEVFLGFSLFAHRGISSVNFLNISQFTGKARRTLEGALNFNDEVSEDIMTGLNQHIWEKPCRISLEQLCNYPIFPNAPDNRTIVESANLISSGEMVVGVRLLGYLRPNQTGDYQFMVASNGFAELWLSPNANWTDSRKIAFVDTQYTRSMIHRVSVEAMRSQISSPVSLFARERYYFEVLYVQDTDPEQEHLIQVAWKRRHESRFKILDGEVLVPYANDSDKAEMKVYDEELPEVAACVRLRRKVEITKQESLPFLEHDTVKDALKSCEYKPSYILRKSINISKFKRFHGVHRHIRKSFSYPFLEVDGVLKKRKLAKPFATEFPLDGTEALSVVSKYLEALKRAYPRRYKLQSIKRIEKKEDTLRGNRYFLELVVKDLTNGSTYVLAEYVFQPFQHAPLCYPSGLQWNRTADVYLILTAKNLGRWVHHFIKNVERIVQETKDDHLHVVVYDFDSPDINLTKVFQRSILKNYHFLKKPGNYSRTISFTEAIDSIPDPNAIAVTVDLHLNIGSSLINDVRKHCIKGKSIYAPLIVYLNCTGTSTAPVGLWYHYSYGTVAMYKQDWLNFGGFSEDFIQKVTWGGEDWDLIDRAVKGGLEVERKRCPWIFHYYHSKKGMWQKAKTTATPTATSQFRPTEKTSVSRFNKDHKEKIASIGKGSSLKRNLATKNVGLSPRDLLPKRTTATKEETT